MATSRAEISQWFDQARDNGSTHMLVVCDTFDWEDYPVFVDAGEDVREIAASFDDKNMQKLMEVYALHLDRDEQLAEGRAFHYESADADRGKP